MQMLIILALYVLSFSVTADAQEPSIEIAGLTITLGMPEEEVRWAIQYPYSIYCSNEVEGIDQDLDGCSISLDSAADIPDIPKNVGGIVFQDGKVFHASRNINVGKSNYDAFVALYEILSELTGGEATCATVMLSDSMIRKDVYLVLPERTVTVITGSRGESRSIAIREGLRINPAKEIDPGRCWPAEHAD